MQEYAQKIRGQRKMCLYNLSRQCVFSTTFKRQFTTLCWHVWVIEPAALMSVVYAYSWEINRQAETAYIAHIYISLEWNCQ